MKSDEKLKSYLQSHIKDAIARGWIKAYYQPIIRTMTEAISGYEALARWDDPNFGLLHQDIFVPALEESKDIYLLDLAICESVCAGFESRSKKQNVLVPISINLSRVDLDIIDIHERINAITKKYCVPHSMIKLEITESVAYNNEKLLEEHIRRFHDDGYSVWMDDFGRGYSTFNTLQLLSFDAIKLDMMFLRNYNEKAAEIIKSIVKLAKTLGVKTICEGVENAEHVKFLKEVGCEFMQGWNYGKPVPLINFAYPTIDGDHCLENVDVQEYWDEISREDLLSTSPLMIIEYEKEKWKILSINDAMRCELDEANLKGMQNINASLEPSHPLYETLSETFIQVAKLQESKNLEYIDNKYFIMLNVTYISSLHDRCALKLSIKNIRTDLEYTKNSLINQGLIGLYSQFELVNEICPSKDCAVQIYSNAGFKKIYGKDSLRQGIKEFMLSEVHPADQVRYAEFMNMDDIKERIKASGINFITEAFRLKNKSGDFQWKLVTLLKESSGPGEQYLYEIQKISHKSFITLDEIYGNM